MHLNAAQHTRGEETPDSDAGHWSYMQEVSIHLLERGFQESPGKYLNNSIPALEDPNRCLVDHQEREGGSAALKVLYICIAG